MNNTTARALILVLLAALMIVTRSHLLYHFAPVPDASWAVFFIAGFYLRGWSRWAFPLFMALAVATDYVAISGQGLNFWAHYCMSPAYWFLIPAYGALWLGGNLVRRGYRKADGHALATLVVSLLASVAVCHLLSQGSFYWLSDSWIGDSGRVPTVAGWWQNYADWFLPYLRTTAIYTGLAVIAHVGVQQIARLARPQDRTAH
ncbi:hypothetical protein CSC70_04235 [Pseudoxanthomonas kalamensis DSM 18571]|uniref:hypothetical protein n=1 Tax=Pseudoxanthomonas kalamensis TaxID=289483 RepID=UPI00139199A2|nr:hypothetical protein [Pseudoxanthomonas kalamensis]KAF1711141.1 hypothetical protein CSC70_04235 [Pseudoxanthomonas kalamensis DSM 18571]